MYLVIGHQGQLGTTFINHPSGYFSAGPRIDLNSPLVTYDSFFTKDIKGIINCAGYTKVDLAESNQAECYEKNVLIPKILAEICINKKIKLIHFSTDYIFDGKILPLTVKKIKRAD